MAENCYCSVTFKTGEELDEALLKAKTACDEAEKAILAKEAIENMEVCTCEVPPGSEPTVEKGVSETGCVKLTFGIPTPKDATVTAENIEAALGYKPANADDMVAGVHVGTEPPDDPNATFYIDTDDDPDDSGGGGASEPDWNAAEGEPGHILNRTHWSEWVEVVPEQTVPGDEELWGYAVESSLVLVAGETYRVKFDGVVYDCEPWTFTEEGMVAVLLGNKMLLGIEDDTGEPFVVMAMDGFVQFLVEELEPEVTLGISAMQYHKIPVQYLPKYAYVIPVLKEEIASNAGNRLAYKSLDTTELVDALLENRPVYLDLTDVKKGTETRLLVCTWNTPYGTLSSFPKDSAMVYLSAQYVTVGNSDVFTLVTNAISD